MLIGDKIRLLRKNKHITQTQLAEALSVSSQTVSKWENHISSPDISILPAIARYFGITMDELFNYRLGILNYKERFIRFMVNNGMLRFGEFTLKSGRCSPYLIHSGYNLTGSQMSKMGEFYAECIREYNIETNCLIGIDNREIPLVIATGMTLFNKYGIDSSHCVDYNIENSAFKAGEITLITDAFTSGNTLCSALERIKSKVKKYPSDIVVSVDRMERSDQSMLSARHVIERKYGVKIHSIVTADDIIKAIENGVISANEHYETFKEYLRRYKGE
ncbi:MAG: helix-turn-helix domain-containing protein [Clostridia bacterium]|nr:helix-turn-helix domain-containing protein [Clostridia bacterium]